MTNQLRLPVQDPGEGNSTMACAPRRFRTFLPATDALESYSPVSVLVPGLGSLVGVAAGPDKVTPAEVTANEVVTEGSATESQSLTSLSVDRESLLTSVDISRNGMVLIGNAPPPETSAGEDLPIAELPSRSDLAMPAIITVSASIDRATSSVVAQSGQPAGAVSSAVSTPKQGGGLIRPMSLIKPATEASGLNAPIMLTGSGGGGPPVYTPTLSFSGSGGGQQLVKDPNDSNHYTMSGSGKVPVGATMTFLAALSDPSVVQSYSWSGGTIASSYFATAGVANPDSYMSLQGPPPTNLSSYTFIVSSTPQHYTVQVTIAYNNTASGQPAPSTLKADFDSVAPSTADFSNITKNNPSMIIQSDNVYISLPLRLPIRGPADTGIRYEVNTSTNTFGGSFMILQLIDVERFLTASGQSKHMVGVDERPPANPPNAPLYNVDDDGLHMGYPSFWVDPSVSPPVTNQVWEWHLDPNQVAPIHISMDNPSLGNPILPTTMIGVGNAAGPEKFVTYIMYKPDSWSGVWVAINKIVWNWGLTETFGVQWVESNRFDQAPPQEVSAAGLYPQWMGRSSQGIALGWVND